MHTYKLDNQVIKELYIPVIAFSGSDFNSDEKLKKVVIDKVKEYQNKFDKIWSDFLTRHNITSNSRLL